jgi:hypothetical protein
MVDLEKWNVRPPVEIGCPRRNALGPEMAPWRIIRGNLICMAFGAFKVHLTSPISQREFDVLMNEQGRVVTFRAGPWRDWWVRDIQELATLVRAAGQEISGVQVYYEYDDDISIIELDVKELDLGRLIHDRWTEGDVIPRINKSHPRAKACWYCPIKRRCDSMDELWGDTDDWPAGYKAGPQKQKFYGSEQVRRRRRK